MALGSFGISEAASDGKPSPWYSSRRSTELKRVSTSVTCRTPQFSVLASATCTPDPGRPAHPTPLPRNRRHLGFCFWFESCVRSDLKYFRRQSLDSAAVNLEETFPRERTPQRSTTVRASATPSPVQELPTPPKPESSSNSQHNLVEVLLTCRNLLQPLTGSGRRCLSMRHRRASMRCHTIRFIIILE